MNKNLFTLEKDHNALSKKSDVLSYDIKHTDFWTIKGTGSYKSVKPKAGISKVDLQMAEN